MAQIIKHRRGSLEALSAVTSSLQKGELVIASGSSNLTVTNGASIVFAVPENGQVQAVNRFLVGNAAPNTFAAGTYNGLVKGVPYYASGSSTLYLLGEGANDIPDLTGNISNFSSSVASSINALSASIGSGAIGTSVAALNTFSGSTLVSLGALNSFSSSQLEKDGTLATYTGSVETRLTEVGVVSGSLIASASAAKTTNDSQNVSITNLNSTTASLNTSVSNINSFTESAQTRFTEIGVVSGSLISSASAASVSITNLNSFSGSQLTQNTALATITGSLIATASNHEQRLDAIEADSGSYARTDSGNVFNGTQVITGSLYITQDLVVYGSSSLLNVTASVLQLGDNTIVLNTSTPAIRFAGIDVIDSGSTQATGSLYWDSLRDHWVSVRPSSSTEVANSAVLIYGPINTGSLGDETVLTAGKIMVALGEDHIGSSIITQNGTTSISVAGDVIVTGSLSVGTLNATNGVVSGSSQIDVTQTTNFSSFSGSVSASIAEVVANVGSGVGVSITNLNSFTSSQLTQNSTLATYTASVETRLTEIGVVSGSLIASASAAKTTNDSQGVSITNLNTFSASVNTSVTALNSSSASQQVSIDALNSFSGSQLTQNTALATVSGSLISSASAANISITNLNTFSGSQLTQNSTLATYTASVDTRLTEIGVVSGSLISSASAASVSITNLNSKSASVDISITNINSFTSSFGTTFSSSVDSRLDTLEGTGTIQGVGTGNNVTFAKVTTTGDVVVGGDLVVQGNTVTLNTATLIVEDKLITLASGSTSSATADGAGIEIAGANANFVYQHSSTSFTSSVALIAPAVTASFNLGSAAGSSKRVAFRNTNGNLDLVPTASVAGDLLQWDGTDFVMSNTIDGGSF
jgi:hypothetical protein